MAHQLEQPGRSLGVEQLGLHGDPARVGRGELVDGASRHASETYARLTLQRDGTSSPGRTVENDGDRRSVSGSELVESREAGPVMAGALRTASRDYEPAGVAISSPSSLVPATSLGDGPWHDSP